MSVVRQTDYIITRCGFRDYGQSSKQIMGTTV